MNLNVWFHQTTICTPLKFTEEEDLQGGLYKIYTRRARLGTPERFDRRENARWKLSAESQCAITNFSDKTTTRKKRFLFTYSVSRR